MKEMAMGLVVMGLVGGAIYLIVSYPIVGVIFMWAMGAVTVLFLAYVIGYLILGGWLR